MNWLNEWTTDCRCQWSASRNQWFIEYAIEWHPKSQLLLTPQIWGKKVSFRISDQWRYANNANKLHNIIRPMRPCNFFQNSQDRRLEFDHNIWDDVKRPDYRCTELFYLWQTTQMALQTISTTLLYEFEVWHCLDMRSDKRCRNPERLTGHFSSFPIFHSTQRLHVNLSIRKQWGKCRGIWSAVRCWTVKAHISNAFKL